VLARIPGAYDQGPGGDTAIDTIGVFSSSATLLANNILNRIVDAIDAGVDISTPNSFVGGASTNIAEDFLFTNTLLVSVPTGATYVFLASMDSY
jgi:hypothetical protein